MDPAIKNIVDEVMGALVPYVAKGAEEFTRSAGKAAFNKVKNLLSTLKKRWSGDKEATENLALFEEEPHRYKALLEEMLKKKLAKDLKLSTKLARIIKEVGPTVEIIQKMEQAENVVGLKGKEIKKGKITISQKTKKAKDVTGLEIEKIG